ncbi:hypothetical protein HD806DRAFT_537948 [Xylariaceae sp. AK1471]|nr:hypothetical protein HD806DRAFT_537948 [Xylariaceae sp. AK1471]
MEPDCGAHSRTTALVEALLEDDPEGMELALNLIHRDCNVKFDDLEVKKIYTLTLVANKYDLSNRINRELEDESNLWKVIWCMSTMGTMVAGAALDSTGFGCLLPASPPVFPHCLYVRSGPQWRMLYGKAWYLEPPIPQHPYYPDSSGGQ